MIINNITPSKYELDFALAQIDWNKLFTYEPQFQSVTIETENVDLLVTQVISIPEGEEFPDAIVDVGIFVTCFYNKQEFNHTLTVDQDAQIEEAIDLRTNSLQTYYDSL